MKQTARWFPFLISSLLATLLSAVSAIAADRIEVYLGPLQFSLSVESLEIFAKEGQITRELANYIRWLNPQQRAQLRSLLQQRVAAKPVTVAQVTYSTVGEALLRSLGDLVQTGSNQNGFYALRSALILGAHNSSGLSIPSAVRAFPAAAVRIDAEQLFQWVASLNGTQPATSETISQIRQQADQEAAQSPVNVTPLPDLRLQGSYTWTTQTLRLQTRDRPVPVTLYLPQVSGDRPIPLVVILPGLATDAVTFDYLAQHLASYGFAVALPDNPDNSGKRFRLFLQGKATEPGVEAILTQSQDVTRLLDELEQRSQSDGALARLNLKQVGVMGHSQGGLSSLLLAGAPLQADLLRQQCQQVQGLFQVNGLLQCQLVQRNPKLPLLRDTRIVAALPISPLVQGWLDQTAVGQIQIPTGIVAATNDFVTPIVPDQVQPFTWLTTPSRYLILVENATHLSPLSEGSFSVGEFQLPPEWVGPEPKLMRQYLQVLSTAFFQTYVANQARFRPYLSATYAHHLSREPLPLRLVQQLGRLKGDFRGWTQSCPTT